ncbi:hypothetical protein J6590_097309 [Homalodisca vitripennis]|nr:hypothetical protein J6590_097309 [Homalodisca vitripennis]
MAQEKGVNISRHEVRTTDGYWLTLHRVGDSKGTPVLLVHGLLASSDQWLLLGPSESYETVTYKIIETSKGLSDVVVASSPGSLHEVAYYDLPAMVEHISRSTDHDRIFYSGYSVGGTLFLMMTAARPEYNRKFLGAFLLAPLLVRPDSTELSPVFRMGFEFIFAFVVRKSKTNLHLICM